MTLLGTTEGSIACAADTLGLTVVRARNRSTTQGCLVATNAANADLCLQNTTASRSIRLAGSTMNFGDLASPGMTLSDNGISLLKDVTVSTHLGVAGSFVAGGAATLLQGLVVSGIINAGANNTPGVYSGMVATVGFAQHVLCCASASSRCLLDFSYGSNSGLPSARIECDPSGANSSPEMKIHTGGSSRLLIQNDLITAETPLTVNGMVTATSVVSPDVMPRSEIVASYQPLLSSAIDDPANGFHSILGSVTAAGKTKCIAGAAGAVILSTHDTIAVNMAPLTGWMAVHGYDDAVATLGMTPLATDIWGPTWSASVRPMSSTTIGSNVVSNSVATFALPTGCQSVFLNQLCWSDASSIDIFGITPTGGSLWLNTVNCYSPFATVSGGVYSGDHQSCIASGCGNFTQIQIAVRRGTFRLKALAYHAYNHPITNPLTPSQNIIGDPASLSDTRLKQSVQPLDGATALNIVAKCGGSTYTRPDLGGEHRLGMVADDVKAAIAGLGVDNVISTTRAQPGDLPIAEYLTLDYSRLVAVLCPAVTELSKQVAELKRQLQVKRKK